MEDGKLWRPKMWMANYGGLKCRCQIMEDNFIEDSFMDDNYGGQFWQVNYGGQLWRTILWRPIMEDSFGK